MVLNRCFAQARERLSKEALTKVGFWEDIMPRINQGNVIPIISNSFRIEQIFHEEKKTPDPSAAWVTPRYQAKYLPITPVPQLFKWRFYNDSWLEANINGKQSALSRKAAISEPLSWLLPCKQAAIPFCIG
ncbi:MAG TPA: hypothetical protein VK206_10915 [Anaerolineales bacterium]|nr:hypothetical protein [Anaerolineales bacterium]